MAHLDEQAYLTQVGALSPTDRKRVQRASRTGEPLDDPRLDALAIEGTRWERRQAGRLAVSMSVHVAAWALLVVQWSGVVRWAIVAMLTACVVNALYNVAKWRRLRALSDREADPDALAPLQAEAPRLQAQHAANADHLRHPDDETPRRARHLEERRHRRATDGRWRTTTS
jgi:hypothetical protein